MPPNTGTYIYNVVITDLGADSQIGVVTEDFADWNSTWPWHIWGLYTWCGCGDQWNHNLGAVWPKKKVGCRNKPNSHIEISVHVDTTVGSQHNNKFNRFKSPPTIYWDMPPPNSTENDCPSGDTGELWMNLPSPGKTFYFELGGCGQHNSFAIKSASGHGLG